MLKALVFVLPLLTVLPVAAMTFLDPGGHAYATARGSASRCWRPC